METLADMVAWVHYLIKRAQMIQVTCSRASYNTSAMAQMYLNEALVRVTSVPIINNNGRFANKMRE